MTTRRRIGVSTATTEAARRQLMQPVPSWEKTWVLTENAGTGPSFKVLKWVKTDKIQQFSDEEEVDEPLAPLPDEPEGDEEDLDETVITADVTPLGGEEVVVKESQEPLSKPHSPQPQLSMSLDPSSVLPVEDQENGLDISLNPFEVDDTMGEVVDVGQKLNPEDMMGLDISALAPDDTDFVGNLEDILAVSMMDQTGDPFVQQVEE